MSYEKLRFRDTANLFLLNLSVDNFTFIHLFNMKYLLYTENTDLKVWSLMFFFVWMPYDLWLVNFSSAVWFVGISKIYLIASSYQIKQTKRYFIIIIDQHLARHFLYFVACLSSPLPFLCSQIIIPFS